MQLNITKVITSLSSLLFLIIGVDKFYTFMEPPCSLMGHFHPMIWKSIGVLQLAAGVLIWLPKIRKHVSGFFAVFMLVFIIIHLMEQTYDIGGAIFMAILLVLLSWNPQFVRPANS